MLRSMFSGVSGLRAHQVMMDVVGNNIANVNTTGYKTAQAIFQDTLSQLLRAPGAPQNPVGGTNPAQVGLGVKMGGIITNFAQGATQLTGRPTDLAIQGDGFFVVRRGGEDLYSRAGAFSFDANGLLVAPDGSVVRGWPATNGVVDSNGAMEDIRLPIGTLLPPKPTAAVQFGGNLPTNAAAGTVISRSIPVYDGQGTEKSLTVTFTAGGDNTWGVKAGYPGGAAVAASPTAVEFSPADGRLTRPMTLEVPGPAGGSVRLDVGQLSQYGSTNTLAVLGQDGSAMGSLQQYSIAPDGTLVGVFSNGLKNTIGRIALATFNNPMGLEKVGDSMFRSSVNSGTAQLGQAGTGGRGTLANGTLEMSNVDLALEFTNLITAQRGFQANSRIISASDEILQDLVNLKR